MKDYIDYMDNISVDQELHDKIMKRVEQKPDSRYRNRTIYRIAGLAACVAVIFACVFAVPGLLNTAGDNVPSNTGGAGDLSQDNAPPDTVDPEGGSAPLQYPLVINNADSQTAESIHIPGHFRYELTPEEIDAILPELDLSLHGTVNYYGDGSIFNVMLHEMSPSGDTAMYNDVYTKTSITLAHGEVIEDVVIDYEPEISDVNGVPVVAGVFDFRKNDGVALFTASFKLDDIAYRISLSDDDAGDSGVIRLTEIVNVIIRGGAADLSVVSDPLIPELLDEQLTLAQAYEDPDFGAYLPVDVPRSFTFDSAHRFQNQSINGVFLHWYSGMDYIEWRVYTAAEGDRERIVHPDEYEKYDMSLYPIPTSDSIPKELWEVVNSPVFLGEELTLDMIKARAYQVEDSGDTAGWRMQFSVLLDDTVIDVSIKGVSPERVFEMLP